MKVYCPKCRHILYTNPFGSNKMLECPYCSTKFYRTGAVNRFLRNYFLADTVVMVLLACVVTMGFGFPVLGAVLLFNLLCDFMFEVPQRYLLHTGQLKYLQVVEKREQE